MDIDLDRIFKFRNEYVDFKAVMQILEISKEELLNKIEQDDDVKIRWMGGLITCSSYAKPKKYVRTNPIRIANRIVNTDLCDEKPSISIIYNNKSFALKTFTTKINVCYATLRSLIVNLDCCEVNGYKIVIKRTYSLKKINYMFDGKTIYKNIRRSEFNKIIKCDIDSCWYDALKRQNAVIKGVLCSVNNPYDAVAESGTFYAVANGIYYFESIPKIVKRFNVKISKNVIWNHFRSHNKMVFSNFTLYRGVRADD